MYVSRHVGRVAAVIIACLATTAALLLPVANAHGRVADTTAGVTMVVPAAAPVIVTARASTPRRWTAMRFAQSKIGGWYLYGGNGPTRYDCSGLTHAAYAHAGITLPRTAADQRYSGRTVAVSASHVRWGDLVFWGTGHVELFGHWTGRVGGSFYSLGFHHSGTRGGYRLNSISGVHFEHVTGAG